MKKISKASVEMGRYEIALTKPELPQPTKPRKERIVVGGDYPKSPFSSDIFCFFGLMHLIAPHLPKKVEVNFGIPKPFRNILNAMYVSEGRRKPTIVGPTDEKVAFLSSKLDVFRLTIPKKRPAERKKVAIAYSGGKDSIWNLWRAIKHYGEENVLAIHIQNLNRNNGGHEFRMVKKQEKNLPIRNLRIIKLVNGSRHNGYQAMRSRDIFLLGMMIPLALEFGADEIMTEGFYEEEPFFSGKRDNMVLFNRALKEVGIPIKVTWKSRPEMDIVAELFSNKPEWMPHVCNCFAADYQRGGLREYCRKRFPSIPLYDSQCGLCAKCRIVNLGRILNDKELIGRARTEDIVAYLESISLWFQRSPEHHHILDRSFLREFAKACKIYGYKPKPLVH